MAPAALPAPPQLLLEKAAWVLGAILGCEIAGSLNL
jgi:hypothetical protein